ncbi:MAG: CsiV family protein [Woeseiaceae bacterium]
MRRLTALLIAAFPAASIQAQDSVPADIVDEAPEIRRYSVEVIVFAYAEPVSAGTEVFPPDVIEPALPDETTVDENGNIIAEPAEDQPAAADARQAQPPQEAPLTDEELLALQEEPLFRLEITPDGDLQLGNYFAALERLDVYEPLLHAGWTQTALPEEDVLPVDVREFGTPPAGLTGEFKLYLSRYLHLVVDLEMFAPEDEQPYPVWRDDDDRFDLVSDETVPRYSDNRSFAGSAYSDAGIVSDAPVFAPLTYKIEENRIFRSEEVRYYDHPKFGVIAKVVRIEEDDPEEEDFPDDTEFLLPPERSTVAQ